MAKEPPVVHVAPVTTIAASKPATICIEGNVPHFGLIVEGLPVSTGQVSPGEAAVHAKYKLISLNDLPHGYDKAPKFMEFIEFLIIGPLQPLIGVVENIVPSALIISKVPQKAKDVLVEPVLLLIDKNNVRVIVVPAVHEPQASSPAFGGRVAATNSKSPDVHELAGGKVCAVAVVKPKKLTNVNISTLLMQGNNLSYPDFENRLWECSVGTKICDLGLK